MRIDARIDPATLGMSLVIPLANYPGRAGNTFPVALYYNSKVWRLNYGGYINGNMVNCVNNPEIEVGTECYTIITPLYAEHSVAGWTFSNGFPTIESGGERYNVNGFACCDGDSNQGSYIARLTVRFPNGATHELRRSDAVLSGADNYLGTYHAVDSSRLKYVTTQAGTGNLYLPDGSRYEVQNWTATRLIDRNGNVALSQTDTLGRPIVAPTFHNGFAHSETHSIPGFNGANRSYTFETALLQDVLEPDLITSVVPQLHRLGDMEAIGNAVYSPPLFISEVGSRVIGGLSTFNPVVLRRIILPNGTSYTFGYNQYGEITRVVYPTGAYERFAYGPVMPLAPIGSPYAQGNRGVFQRRISASGLAADEVTWNYSSTGTVVTTTVPDGTVTVRYLLPSNSAGTVVFGLEDPRAGMVYDERIYAPAAQGGAMLRRTLTNWDYSGPLSGGHGNAQRNPRVNRQVDIILDTGGNALATATEMNYDADLNITSTRRYGFVSLDQTTAQTAAVAAISNGTLLRTEEIDYLTDNTNYRDRHLLALPVATRVRDGVGNLVAQSSIIYDETSFPLLAYGAVTGWLDPGTNVRGNATTVSTWLNTTNSFLSVHTQYDQCGSVRNVWDARDTGLSSPARLEYAATHERAYATSRSSADPDGAGPLLSLVDSTEFDSTTGLVKAAIDANGQRTTFSYNDPLNRLTQITRAETDPAAKTQTSYSYDDTARTFTVTSDLTSFNDNALKTMTLFDGLGRATEARAYEGGSNYIVTQTQYDILGRPFKSSNPYRPWAPSESAVWTTTAFDALGRVTSVTTPDNAVVSTAYSGNSVTVTDQAGRTRKSVTDALGRLIEVYEDPSGLNYLTTYSYDTLDNLVKVTQGSQQRFFMYDSLKRLIRVRNPEQDSNVNLNLADPLTGNSAWSTGYQYDANSNLTKRTDARNVDSTYVYDALNRNTSIEYSDTLVSPDVSRFYDGATNGKGKLWYSYAGGNGSQGINVEKMVLDSYDPLGRPLVLRQFFKLNETWSPFYEVSRSYNRAGGVTSQTYPSEHSVTYNYDAAGRLADKDAANLAFTGNLGDGVPRTYSRGISYAAAGQLKQEQFGTATPSLYHKLFYNSRQQLAEILVSTSVGNTYDRGKITNGYSLQCLGAQCDAADNNGDLRKQKIEIPTNEEASTYVSWIQQYDYDTLNRLQSVSEAANGAQQWRQWFSYDRWGNRTIDATQDQGDPNPRTYGTGINNKAFQTEDATNRLYAPGDLALAENQRRIRYDLAGNQINDTYTGSGTATFDADNHIIAIQDKNGGTANYTYNADGQRTRRKIGNQESWQIYGMDGELLAEYPAGGATNAPQKEYGYRNGQLLVTAEPSSGPPVNVALASNGATAIASSTFSGFAASGAINGDRKGLFAWQNGFWSTASAGFPAWLEVQFNGSKTITEIDVVTIQDNYNAPIEPTESTAFSQYGLTAYQVQYWNESVWVTIPNGTLSSNNKVWKKFSFAPISTTKIRVLSSASPDNYSRLAEVEAWTGPSPAPRYNLALAGTATASSNWSGWPPSSCINGDRKSLNAGTDGGWVDAAPANTFPDWLQVDFGANRTINEVDVFTLQDSYAGSSEPTESMTFTQWGSTAYTVEYWSGSGWIQIPGASVTGNNKIWRKFEFSPITTSKIRVVTSASVDGYSRLTEVEAYGPADASGSGGVQWLVSDHLGTPRMVLDETGNLANVTRHDYLPFGEELISQGLRSASLGYASGDGVRQQFTSKERDVETGLDYFLARYYSSNQGRFTSPDEFTGGPDEVFVLGSGDPEKQALVYADVNNPQSLNKYQYVFNNPLRYVDPDGRSPQDRLEIEMRRAEREFAEGKITKDEFLARVKAWGIGGVTGAALVLTGVAGPRVALAILAWATRNPEKVNQLTQEAVQASSGNPTSPAGGLTTAEIGLLREAKVAALVGGKVSRQQVIVIGLGRTDIDVIGKAGEYIAVGGPAKTASDVGRQLQILKAAAEQAGVKCVAFFARGTPEEVLKVARRRLGEGNVHIFEDVK